MPFEQSERHPEAEKRVMKTDESPVDDELLPPVDVGENGIAVMRAVHEQKSDPRPSARGFGFRSRIVQQLGDEVEGSRPLLARTPEKLDIVFHATAADVREQRLIRPLTAPVRPI